MRSETGEGVRRWRRYGGRGRTSLMLSCFERVKRLAGEGRGIFWEGRIHYQLGGSCSGCRREGGGKVIPPVV